MPLLLSARRCAPNIMSNISLPFVNLCTVLVKSSTSLTKASLSSMTSFKSLWRSLMVSFCDSISLIAMVKLFLSCLVFLTSFSNSFLSSSRFGTSSKSSTSSKLKELEFTSPCAMRQSIAFSLSDSDSELDDDESSQVALKLFFPFFLSNTFLDLQSALM
ncbi:hypothetical protein Syun_012438 [Stephania yunnanensis]|uniref:Uncharacterized protein n=1 Tax=Stephania yunnanensis TaxID=152371 RepID=A0AAP0JZE8_9MAGN